MAKKIKKKPVPEHQRRAPEYCPEDRLRLLKALQGAHGRFDEMSQCVDCHKEKTAAYNALKTVRVEYRKIFLSEAPDRQTVSQWLFQLNKKTEMAS